MYWRSAILLGALLALTSCGDRSATASGNLTEARTENPSAKNSQPLASVIAEAKKYAVDAANRSDAASAGGNGFRYSASKPVIRRADFDGDGIRDAVVIITICEASSCHASTHDSYIVLARNVRSGFTKIFSFSAGIDPVVDAIKPGLVSIIGLAFGPDDPGCCATEKHTFTISIKGDLVALKERTAREQSPAPEVSSGDVALPKDKAHCRDTGQGCEYDTGWQPKMQSTFQAVPIEDSDSGAGCGGTDSNGKLIFSAEMDGAAKIKIGGIVMRLPPMKIRYGEMSSDLYSSDVGSLSLSYGPTVGGRVESSIRKASMSFVSPTGVRSTAEMRFECGA